MPAMSAFHDLQMPSITGEDIAFSDYEGTVCLVVNVASQCGLTPQYSGLQELHAAHRDNGFTVLGFPCNQFGGQEPGTDAEVCEWVDTNYSVDFPLFSKIEVNGDGTCELYRLLKQAQPGEGDSSDIQWNFEKFLVAGDGEVVARFSPMTTPDEIADLLPNYL